MTAVRNSATLRCTPVGFKEAFQRSSALLCALAACHPDCLLKLPRIEHRSPFDDQRYVAKGVNVGGGIAVDQDDVRELSRRDRSELIVVVHHARRTDGC